MITREEAHFLKCFDDNCEKVWCAERRDNQNEIRRLKDAAYFNDARVAKLVEALEFYADEGNYTHDEYGNHMSTAYENSRCGIVARQAIAEFRGAKGEG